MGRAVGTFVQFGTSLSSLAQSLISLWFDPVDCHDYHSRGYHVISCVDLYSAFTFRKPCLYSLFVRAACAGAIYRTEVCTEIEDSISEEALGAFGKSQTYRYPSEDIQRIYELFVKCRGQDKYRDKGYDRGQEAEQNTVEDRIMDSGASFHATYCKEELERFKLRSGKVRLADDKTLDIAGVGDVVLKTSFGTSWTLKDVRYIPSLKKRLISVGQLDEEGYHVGFGDQQWKVTKGSLVVAHGNKRVSLIGISMLASKGNVPDVRKIDIYLCKPGGLGKQKKLSFIMSVKTKKLQRLEQVHTEAGVVLSGYEESPGYPRSRDITVVAQMKCDTAFGIRRVTRLSEKQRYYSCGSDEMRYSFRDTKSHQVIREAEILQLWTRFMEPVQKSLRAHVGAQIRVRGPKTVSFEDSGRSDEYSEDGASFKEGGSETPQVRRSTRVSRAPVRKAIIEEMVSLKMNKACSLVRLLARKNASQSLGMFMVKEEQDGSKRYKARLMVKGFQQKRGKPSYVGALNDTSTQHKSKGFQLAGQKENLECRLKEILYGLIQAPRLRYLKFDSFMQKDKALTWQNSTSLSVGITTVEWESGLQKSITMLTIEV
ncbi:retrovirus-related pol polyprotein from transposon TNT 1-94 [Tanacetum coccineum]|uniref:Retrovirus-related pol polyprotein from transposon TNT 1-94 n=1 Tax=Tanacetum coccineum TaxID=301880 RepID=A0ABQ5AMU0_9ASTR